MESKRGVDHTDSIRFPSLAADRQGPVIGGFERVPSPIPQFLPVFLRSPQPLPAQTAASQSLPRCILEPHEPAHTPIRLGFVFSSSLLCPPRPSKQNYGTNPPENNAFLSNNL